MPALVICDDVKKDIEQLTLLVQQYQNSKAIYNLSVYTFENGESLLAKMTEGFKGDIYLLDIDMPELNGLELARRIREKKENAIIIFVTRSLDYCQQGYEYGFRYVNKENLEPELTKALDAAFLKLKREREYRKIELVTLSKRIYIPISDIQLIERVQRRVHVYTQNHGKLVLQETGIQKLYQQLGEEQFIMCDRGCIVNIDYVQEIENDKLRLTACYAGKALETYISRRRKKAVIQALNQCIKKNLT